MKHKKMQIIDCSLREIVIYSQMARSFLRLEIFFFSSEKFLQFFRKQKLLRLFFTWKRFFPCKRRNWVVFVPEKTAIAAHKRDRLFSSSLSKLCFFNYTIFFLLQMSVGFFLSFSFCLTRSASFPLLKELFPCKTWHLSHFHVSSILNCFKFFSSPFSAAHFFYLI